jgi:polyphosphate kinase 2 (PPK2 family)
MADIVERRFWKDYMRAYEQCLSATSTRNAPWYIVPADDKVNARLIVSEVIVDTLQRLSSPIPKIDAARRHELATARGRLAK